MKLTAESTVVNDGKLNTNIKDAKETAESALDVANGSIVTDTIHYLATSASSGVTTSTTGWTTTIQSMTATKKYLWTYHTYTKANGTSVDTTPVITGTYGEKGDTGGKGDTGVGITNVQPQYYLSTSSSSLAGGSWGTALSYETGKYIWTREKISYSDNTTGYSTAIYNSALTTACANAENALSIATSTAQYFWFKSSGNDAGAHITQKTQSEFEADPSGGNLLATSNGIAVRDGTTDLAVFGADGMQIGKDDEKHIRVTNKDFNVYDEDGSIPFSVSTGSSRRTATVTGYVPISGTNGSYPTVSDRISLRGSLENNRIYFAVSTTKPSTFTQYVTVGSGTTSVTINGVKCSVTITDASFVNIVYTNTGTTNYYVAYKFTETYYQTDVKVNDATLTTTYRRLAIQDTTGTHVAKYCYAYTYGKVVTVHIVVYNTSSITVGNTIYKGELFDLIPIADAPLVAVKNGVIVGLINSEGVIIVSNTGTAAFSTTESSPLYLRGTYICK